jgi:hypothetical protein
MINVPPKFTDPKWQMLWKAGGSDPLLDEKTLELIVEQKLLTKF